MDSKLSMSGRIAAATAQDLVTQPTPEQLASIRTAISSGNKPFEAGPAGYAEKLLGLQVGEDLFSAGLGPVYGLPDLAGLSWKVVPKNFPVDTNGRIAAAQAERTGKNVTPAELERIKAALTTEEPFPVEQIETGQDLVGLKVGGSEYFAIKQFGYGPNDPATWSWKAVP